MDALPQVLVLMVGGAAALDHKRPTESVLVALVLACVLHILWMMGWSTMTWALVAPLVVGYTCGPATRAFYSKVQA